MKTRNEIEQLFQKLEGVLEMDGDKIQEEALNDFTNGETQEKELKVREGFVNKKSLKIVDKNRLPMNCKKRV